MATIPQLGLTVMLVCHPSLDKQLALTPVQVTPEASPISCHEQLVVRKKCDACNAVEASAAFDLFARTRIDDANMVSVLPGNGEPSAVGAKRKQAVRFSRQVRGDEALLAGRVWLCHAVILHQIQKPSCPTADGPGRCSDQFADILSWQCVNFPLDEPLLETPFGSEVQLNDYPGSKQQTVVRDDRLEPAFPIPIRDVVQLSHFVRGEPRFGFFPCAPVRKLLVQVGLKLFHPDTIFGTIP
jgi:hypothetical protein